MWNWLELNELSSIGCLKRMEWCKEDFNKTKDHGEIVVNHGMLGKKGDCDSCVVFLIAKLKQVSRGE